MSKVRFGSAALRANPASNALAEKITYALYNPPDASLDAITELHFTRESGGWDLSGLPESLTEFAAPNLTLIPTPNYASMVGLPNLHTVRLPLLVSAANLIIQSIAALTLIEIPNLSTTQAPESLWTIAANPLLAELALPRLATPPNTINLSSNALTDTSVNNVLIQLDAIGWAAAGKSLHLSGGTNAPPSGAGATAKLALIAAGATVTTN